MGLEAIVGAIAAEAATQVAEVQAAAEHQVAEILDDAHRRAASARQERETGRDAEAARARARIVNRAHLEADRQLAEAREQMFQEAPARVRRRLKEATDGPGYPDVLRRLLSEASAVLPNDALTIRLRAADQPIVAGIVADESMAADLDASLDGLGGLDIETTDGRAVRNSLETRLARSERQLRLAAVEAIPELATGRANL